METLSRTLAKYVAGLRYEDLPPDVVQMAKLTYLDWVGNAWAGTSTPPSQMARAVGQGMGKNDDALLFDPNDLRHWAPAAVAAFVNGVSTHILELDDVHKASTMHAGTVVLPAALAASQRGRVDGRRLIEAIVAGFDVAIRIGEAVNPAHD
ncbi:MAG: MmgE/PrpD family protein, partial [Chloroflexi bacterium]|nr:MmgE/PrpD family protein [Chloroflexota bacterium]